MFSLNLNVYRNTHYHTLNTAKIEMVNYVRRALPDPRKPLNPPLRFVYTIFPATARVFDLGNVCSIVQKFTDDALVKLGVIKDDNMKIISEVVYRFGSVDKKNPRAELCIEIINWL